jgi:DNA-binding response OmpR family regulator
MAKNGIWQTYPATYRAKEMKMIAHWIEAGDSGSIVGLSGSGRSNLMGFLCHRPEVLQTYFSSPAKRVALVPVDLNNLPGYDLSTLYRTILHAFYWVRERFDPTIQQAVSDLYLENRAVQDPFLVQRVLYDVLLLFQEQQTQVVLIFNRFDRFCHTATPQMINTLRGLRDTFKDTLCFIVGMLQEAVYLPDPAALGDMYELLDIHVCWVGAMTESDSWQMIDRTLHTAPRRPTELELNAILTLSGRFPVLLKAVAHWWQATLDHLPPIDDWLALLSADSTIQYRIERMWQGLTQEERQVLAEMQKLLQQAREQTGTWVPGADLPARYQKAFQKLTKEQSYALSRLEAKGLSYRDGPGWQITSELLAAYVAKIEGRVPGKIWLDEKAKIVYQGNAPVEDITTLQYEILRFLIKNPQVKHTRDAIIDSAWPPEDHRVGISPNALQVQIASIRKKIEPQPARPRYLITWIGRPGGYQFFPEGKPG